MLLIISEAGKYWSALRDRSHSLYTMMPFHLDDSLSFRLSAYPHLTDRNTEAELESVGEQNPAAHGRAEFTIWGGCLTSSQIVAAGSFPSASRSSGAWRCLGEP